MKYGYLLITTLCLTVPLTACKGEAEQQFPQILERERLNERGKMTGDGLTLLGREQNEASGGVNPLGVNSFLWRASLDTISFLPLRSADPFGGVIITDWYEDPNNKGERYKLDILITDKALRADAVKVNVFRQKQGMSGEWQDMAVNKDTNRSIEDAILTRARELRVKQGGT